MRVIDNFARRVQSVPLTPRTTLGAHFEKNTKTMQTDSGD